MSITGVHLQKTILSLIFLTTLSLTLFAGGVQESPGAAGAGEPDIDNVGIAAVMLRDGNLSRAQSALDKVDVQDDAVDLARYYTLRGLLLLRTGEESQAIDAFESALENGQDDPSIYAYIAQANFTVERYYQVIAAIDQVPNRRDFPGLYGVQAAAEWNLDRWPQAMETLQRAELLFPDRIDFTRQRITYLLELGLTQEAARQSLEFLEAAPDEPDVYITIGEALRRGGQFEAAAQVLEGARIRFPGNEQIKLILAQTYVERNMPRAAASLIEEAAANNFSLYYEAAELYRRVGSLSKALYLNSQVLDAGRKTRQRFNLLLSMERFEEAAALESRLDQMRATEDDTVRYSLAYAYYRNGQWDRSIDYLRGISDSEVFSRAVQLRDIVETAKGRER